VRLERSTLKALIRARTELMLEWDLKVSQSDLVEAALLRQVQDLDSLAAAVRDFREGTLRAPETLRGRRG
jgi:hypothetical protein